MIRKGKILVFIFLDILIFWVSLAAASALRFGNLFHFAVSEEAILLYALLCVAAILINSLFGCYRYTWRFAGVTEALRLIFAALVQLLVFAGAVSVYETLSMCPDSSALIAFAHICVLIELMLMCATRFAGRFALLIGRVISGFRNRKAGKRILIYGNVQDSKAVIEKFYGGGENVGKVVCIVSTEALKEKESFLYGIRVMETGRKKPEDFIKKFKANVVVISKNDIPKDELFRIVKFCSGHSCELKVYSGVEDFPSGIRRIDVNDLLGRAPTVPEKRKISAFIRGKIILVSGGAGSIGSEICRQALEYGCSRLIIFDINENGLFSLDYELKKRFSKERYRTVVGSVRDEDRLDEIFAEYRPEVVFHAAAHKHVPMMELNPGEAVKNNVLGTRNIAKKAIDYGTGCFILISTDKAVNPVNVMGATKRAAEMIVQSLNAASGKTKLAAVRFGNVLDSNGSVVPIFRKQILSGGPVTITHPDMERYFMTIAEAVQLVMQAGAMAGGGEIYVLDMGSPVKIVDLANAMIRLYGMEPGKDIRIEYTGQRPGEKLTEELLSGGETCTQTDCHSIFVCKSDELEENFRKKYERLAENLNKNSDYRKLLKELVAQYEPAPENRVETDFE